MTSENWKAKIALKCFSIYRLPPETTQANLTFPFFWFCFLVEWSCSEDFSPLVGEIIMENLQSLRCTITGLTMVNEKLLIQIAFFFCLKC